MYNFTCKTEAVYRCEKVDQLLLLPIKIISIWKQ